MKILYLSKYFLAFLCSTSKSDNIFYLLIISKNSVGKNKILVNPNVLSLGFVVEKCFSSINLNTKLNTFLVIKFVASI